MYSGQAVQVGNVNSLCKRAVRPAEEEPAPPQSKRTRRTPGGDAYVNNKQHFREFINRLILNDPSLGTLHGRVLRLKDYVSPDASTSQLDMVIECLKQNVRVEVLYIQNFEKVPPPCFHSLVCVYVVALEGVQEANKVEHTTID
jgi:hypothetical protein